MAEWLSWWNLGQVRIGVMSGQKQGQYAIREILLTLVFAYLTAKWVTDYVVELTQVSLPGPLTAHLFNSLLLSNPWLNFYETLSDVLLGHGTLFDGNINKVKVIVGQNIALVRLLYLGYPWLWGHMHIFQNIGFHQILIMFQTKSLGQILD